MVSTAYYKVCNKGEEWKNGSGAKRVEEGTGIPREKNRINLDLIPGVPPRQRMDMRA